MIGLRLISDLRRTIDLSRHSSKRTAALLLETSNTAGRAAARIAHRPIVRGIRCNSKLSEFEQYNRQKDIKKSE